MDVPIWRGKRDQLDCNNYSGNSLLSVLGKVLGHLLLMRTSRQVLKLPRLQESGFASARSTTDRIVAHCVMVECRRKFGIGRNHVDLEKTFDALHREALWDLL